MNKALVLIKSTDEEIVVAEYINAINQYCEKDYDLVQKNYIEKMLLSNPGADIVNDLPGSEERQCQARYYLMRLKRDEVKVTFNKKFQIKECKINNNHAKVGVLEKSLTDKNGKAYHYVEYLELLEKNKTWRIHSISSSLFSGPNEINCKEEGSGKKKKKKKKDQSKTKPKEMSCAVFAMAERAYRNQNYAKALSFYKEALTCSDKRQYIEEKIAELNTVNKIKSALKKADNFYKDKNYENALRLYRLVGQSKKMLDKQEGLMVENKITSCELEIEFTSVMFSGNEFFKKGYYDKALVHYKEALAMKQDDKTALSQKKKCELKIKQNYSKKIREEIALAETLIQKKKYDKGLILLMKHRLSGYLTGRHFFYMAQIMDTEPASVKKRYKLNAYDCCVLTRQFALEAREAKVKNYDKKDFHYFWNDHLNSKSRRCK